MQVIVQICFVGDLEKTNGTQRAFPYECQARNNLVRDCGLLPGSRLRAFYISRAPKLNYGFSHSNLIYNMHARS